MTALNKQELRSKSRAASAGKWIKESGDGWEAICSSDDQANGNFIIAHFEGPDAEANREFVQVANPDTMLALLDENLQLQRDKDSLEAVTIAMRDDMRDAREKLETAEKRNADQHGIILSARNFISEYAVKGDVGAAEFVKLLDRTAGIGVKGE
ncbi:ead/Ea22-like family protein [Salmonella enterica subsp. enterica]|nr:ead/Ea22-like family protein [Salmonella enterica subsp. enterica]